MRSSSTTLGLVRVWTGTPEPAPEQPAQFGAVQRHCHFPSGVVLFRRESQRGQSGQIIRGRGRRGP
jgi:hypothetical protein